MAGYPTPRPAVEIWKSTGSDVLKGKGKVITVQGKDITGKFVSQTDEVLKLVESFPVKAAILKERSPSCGVHQIYDGTFTSVRVEGQGVTAAFLKNRGIPVYSEEEVDRNLLERLLSL